MKKLMLFLLAALLSFAAANAQGTATVVVAEGTATNNYVPIYGLYVDDFLRCQTIYPESLLTEIAGKEIQGITYYLTTPAAASWGTAVFEIKMGTVEAAAFPTTDPSWASAESFTTVYTGDYSELTVVNVADIWRERNVWYQGRSHQRMETEYEIR